MPDLLHLSSRVLDQGRTDEPINRVTNQLSELTPAIAVVESFSHVVLFRTAAGLVAFDTSGAETGRAVLSAIRGWSSDPFHTLVYTHGHIDHVGGSGAFVAEATARGDAAPCVVGHENIPARFERYRRTDGYNRAINVRQFGWLRKLAGPGPRLGIGGMQRFLPEDTATPSVTYRQSLSFRVGDLDVELRHARGETDDHSWAWIPEHRAICAGDFFIWNFPNAGNPQKVQRYPAEWAQALRAMAAMDAELFLPAHGLPIEGRQRIRGVLEEVAQVLENLVRETLQMMNAGARLDEILHSVRVPPEVLARPYLRPLYDEPQFVVRNIWRQYGGWYDGNPAHLKPAPDAELAHELAALAGGARPLADRARTLGEQGSLRTATHLIEYAALAAPEDKVIHAIRAELYGARRSRETSLMAKGIFAHAARESSLIAENGIAAEEIAEEELASETAG